MTTVLTHAQTLLTEQVKHQVPLQALDSFCRAKQVDWYIFGGVVRDTVSHVLHAPEETPPPVPHDWDVYVCAPWHVFESIRNQMDAQFGIRSGIDLIPCHNVLESAGSADFTCNSMLYCPKTQQILDPYGGVDSIINKVFLVIEPALFVLNPPACLRAIRLAQKLEFELPGSLDPLLKQSFAVLAGAEPFRISRALLEWLQILSVDAFGAWYERLNVLGATESLFPVVQCYRDSCVWQAMLERQALLERLITGFTPEQHARWFASESCWFSVKDHRIFRNVNATLSPIATVRAAILFESFSPGVMQLKNDPTRVSELGRPLSEQVSQKIGWSLTQRFSAIEGLSTVFKDIARVMECLAVQSVEDLLKV